MSHEIKPNQIKQNQIKPNIHLSFKLLDHKYFYYERTSALRNLFVMYLFSQSDILVSIFNTSGFPNFLKDK